MLKSRTILISVILLFSFLLNAQDLRVTFTASGASSTVDSVKATNLRTNNSVSLPGNDTLYLELNTGISELSGSGKNGIVFPNPCSGTATLIFPSIETGTSILCLMNLSGQVLVRISAEILKGDNIWKRLDGLKNRRFLAIHRLGEVIDRLRQLNAAILHGRRHDMQNIIGINRAIKRVALISSVFLCRR